MARPTRRAGLIGLTLIAVCTLFVVSCGGPSGSATKTPTASCCAPAASGTPSAYAGPNTTFAGQHGVLMTLSDSTGDTVVLLDEHNGNVKARRRIVPATAMVNGQSVTITLPRFPVELGTHTGVLRYKEWFDANFSRMVAAVGHSVGYVSLDTGVFTNVTARDAVSSYGSAQLMDFNPTFSPVDDGFWFLRSEGGVATSGTLDLLSVNLQSGSETNHGPVGHFDLSDTSVPVPSLLLAPGSGTPIVGVNALPNPSGTLAFTSDDSGNQVVGGAAPPTITVYSLSRGTPFTSAAGGRQIVIDDPRRNGTACLPQVWIDDTNVACSTTMVDQFGLVGGNNNATGTYPTTGIAVANLGGSTTHVSSTTIVKPAAAAAPTAPVASPDHTQIAFIDRTSNVLFAASLIHPGTTPVSMSSDPTLGFGPGTLGSGASLALVAWS